MTSPRSLHATVDDGVGLLRIDRPDARNALSADVMAGIVARLSEWDDAPEVRAVVIAGTDEHFAAGSDLKAMRERELVDAITTPTARFWATVAGCGMPVIAAVSGWALGGGCELALACDMIVAAPSACFGQPEILLGIVPGGGGSQRLVRAVGKHRAMELVLTGRRIDAHEAHAMGIVTRLVGQDTWLDEALALAHEIATRAPIATQLAKRAILAADETSLSAGLAYERRLYELSMATEDRREGMSAFFERRQPRFTGK